MRIGSALGRCAVLAIIGWLSTSRTASAIQKDESLASRRPRFLYSPTPNAEPILIRTADVIRRRVSLDMHGTLSGVLAELSRQTGVAFIYGRDVVDADRHVDITAERLTLAAALTQILLDADIDVVFSPNDQAVLVRRPVPPPKVRITGRVIDSKTGDPIPGVVISLSSASQGGAPRFVSSSERGEYEFASVDSGAYTISARRLGYRPTSRTIATTSVTLSVDLTVEQVPSALTEVVTTVTGAQRRAEIGNATATVAADSLAESAPIRNLDEMLAARVSGVVVNFNTGHTGVSSPIRVRGAGSVVAVPTNGTAKDPLVVVDGARVDNSTTRYSNSDVVGFGQSSGRLNDLPPGDIESIEIVKGPAAATLYGTDAANGVIVVKTKRGKAGVTRWNLTAERGTIDQPANWPLSYYSWGHSKTGNVAQQCLVAQFAAGACAIDSLTSYSPMRDKSTTIAGTGNRTLFGAQVSGGAGQLSFFVSGDFEDELGVLRMPDSEQARISAERGGVMIPDEQIHPNRLRRVNVRGNLTSAVGGSADVTLSTALIRSDARLPSPSAGYLAAYYCPGFKPQPSGWCQSANTTAPGEAFAVRNNEDVTHFVGSVAGNWRITNWMDAHGTLGTDYSDALMDALQRNGEGPLGVNRAGRRQNTNTSIALYTGDARATAFSSFGSNATSKSSIGLQFNRRVQHVTTARATGLPPGSETVTGATTVTSAESNIEAIVAGAYAEQTLGLRDRLFLTGAIRADGGSTFGKNFRTAVYPKASASWVISQEPFMPRIPALSSLRLRGAYGTSGVQPSSTAALALEQIFTVQVNGAAASGASLAAVGNPDLRPERRAELEGGVDAEFLDGIVRFEGTYYTRRATDALIDRPLPQSNGLITGTTAASRPENLGVIKNWGWEGLLAGQMVRRKDVTIDVALNGSIQHNRLVSLLPGITFVGNANPGYRARPGFPLYGRFDRPVLSFADANGNGIIESSEVVVGDTIAFIGSSTPTHLLTTTLGASFWSSRVRISSQFEHRGGALQINFTELNRCNFYIVCAAANDPSADLWQQARLAARNDPTKGATWAGYFDDASFTRWREFAITVQLPDRLAQRVVGTRAGSLTIAARNLKLWTQYLGPDPEVNGNPGLDYTEGGIDAPTAPASRYWIVRLSLHY
jgi:TonB-linked SusC/RagA family outer membrane protein